MKKVFLIIGICLLGSNSLKKKKNWGIQGGFGSSWVAMPRTYISDRSDPESNTFEIYNAETRFSGYLGVTFHSQISISNFHFSPEFNLNYVSGNVVFIRSNSNGGEYLKDVQQYLRAEIPLIFEVATPDLFAFMIGIVPFANLYNSNTASYLANEVGLDSEVDSSFPVGLRTRFGVSKIYNNRYRFTIKWDIDNGRGDFIKYNDNHYKIRLYTQSVSLGFNYLF